MLSSGSTQGDLPDMTEKMLTACLESNQTNKQKNFGGFEITNKGIGLMKKKCLEQQIQYHIYQTLTLGYP